MHKSSRKDENRFEEMFMFDTIFEMIFFIGLIIVEVIRFPHRLRVSQYRKRNKMQESRIDFGESILLTMGFVGMWVIPLIYLFSSWIDGADLSLSSSMGWFGGILFLCVIAIIWKAHADLGKNWSPSLEINEGQQLVTSGMYEYIRHPIYLAVWFQAMAQFFLLQNWVAGCAGIVSFLPIYLIRVPREEKMMVDLFGREYQTYMKKTGRILPPYRRLFG
jgi:protein-S-isoprenylcysteine O-methyltransferase Ste14